MLSKLLRRGTAVGAGIGRTPNANKSFAQAQRCLSTSTARQFGYFPRPQEEDARPLQPRYWTGKSAVDLNKIQVNCKGMDLPKLLAPQKDGSMVLDPNTKTAETLRDAMKETYDNRGVVILKNTGCTKGVEMEALTRLINDAPEKYEGGANLRGALATNVYDTGAPRFADLQYHHEMAYVKDTPTTLTLMCLEHTIADKHAGATFLSENTGATKDLMMTQLGQKLKEKGLCYVRKLPDQKYFLDNNLDSSIVYNFWQTSMLSEDPAEAEAMARSKGLDVEWEESPIFGRYMVTKFYASCFEYDKFNDMNALFASIADDHHWFDSWPGVMDLPHWERPLKLNFGDDEVMTREEKELFVDVYDMHGVPVFWEQGDVAITCNVRWAHGRPKYELKKGEKRELGVVLGNFFKRQGDLPDKW